MRFDHRLTIGDRRSDLSRQPKAAFTLLEVMIVLLLIGILMVAGFGALYSMDFCSRRAADHTAATSIVEAKLQDVLAATYKSPGTNFGAGTIYKTNSDSISVNQAGTTFRVPGTLVTEIKPFVSGGMVMGHLVTVTGTFQEPRGPITVSLQTFVNKFTGGQQ